MKKKIGLLRPIADSELELMLSWRNVPKVRENMYKTHEISLSEHLEWWQRVSSSETQRYFIYEFSGQPLGVVGFTDIDFVNKNSFWAFYAAPSAPRGTGSRMELLALDYAFKDLRINKLICEVLAFNTSVIKLHQKFGFKIEGVLRNQYYRGDEFIDIYRLGILMSEWESIRDAVAVKVSKFSKGHE